MTTQQRNRRIERAKTRILFHNPFFFAGAVKLGDVVWDDTVPTACTDGKRIKWNPDWFDTLKDPELNTVLCEEVGHCLFQHLYRKPPGADPVDWNRACDHMLRNMMVDWNEANKASGKREPFEFPDPANSLPDRAYKGMAEEAIFRLMPKLGNNGGQQPTIKPPGTTGQPGQQPQPGQPQPLGDFTAPKNEKDHAKDKSGWDQTAIESVMMGQRHGELPAQLQRLVHEMVSEPALPWWEMVANWLREKASDDWDWSKPNPFYDETGFILPSLHSEKLGVGVFAKDTSGSINEDTLSRFVGVQQQFLDEMRPSKMIDLCCDAKLQQEREYRPGDTVDMNAPGGGGTDFTPVFKRVDELGEPIKCLIYLTDLEGTFPTEEPPYPVLWVVWGKKDKAPFGQVVKVDRD